MPLHNCRAFSISFHTKRLLIHGMPDRYRSFMSSQILTRLPDKIHQFAIPHSAVNLFGDCALPEQQYIEENLVFYVELSASSYLINGIINGIAVLRINRAIKRKIRELRTKFRSWISGNRAIAVHEIPEVSNSSSSQPPVSNSKV